MNVFVTDGDERPALAIVRSLGRRGAQVIVGADRLESLASSSKYCSRAITYPSPATDRNAFVAFLLDFLSREHVDVVLPVTDVTTHAVCANRDRLGNLTGVAVPTLEAFEFVRNKKTLMDRAAACGIPIPRSEYVTDANAIRRIARQLRFPAVVKPAHSRVPAAAGWRATGVHYANTIDDLLHLYDTTDYLRAYPFLVQERIAGDGVGVFGLFERGTLLVEFGHRRLREKPPSGGVSVLRESVSVDSILRRHLVDMLQPLGWHGVAMMEFKQDRRTGEFFLMEVNGRFWGSLQLAIDAGVDFPAYVCDLALERWPVVPATYRTGVKSRWLFGDLDHLMLRLLKSPRDLNLDADAASKWRTVRDFLRVRQPDLHYEVLSAADPGPFLHECRTNAISWRTSMASAARNLIASFNPKPRHISGANNRIEPADSRHVSLSGN